MPRDPLKDYCALPKREPLTEELSLACQWGRCQDCPWNEDDYAEMAPGWCLCDHHIDDPGDDYESRLEVERRWTHMDRGSDE